ncbi:hypothetical protein SAMN04488029_0158 [Reichenbachiella faecimaris]|uniref:Uncharacterized protein n=1 Tax=Reichenbachiella faecimaris TaxID=692418 RepID=A0A1W2G577_REIFA|nr:hypothetical protein [Reichenbachiella faecimaris]SMD31820.1 hypothetical protein SAMN04488029_0158 [Reichenbachiella faecimaris]
MKKIIPILLLTLPIQLHGQSLSDTLTVDIDGKGALELVYFGTGSCKTLIISGGDLDYNLVMGCGTKVAHIDEFNWVENWKVVEKKETWKTTFLDNGDIDDTRMIQMQNDGIYVGQTDPTGGGIITFMDGKLTWIHQGD